MILQKQIKLETNGHGHMLDITRMIGEIVSEAGIRTGIANIANIGSTAAIGAIEVEPGLEKDLPQILDTLIPPSENYGHEQTWGDGNGHSHLQATILGQALTIPVGASELVLGMWQQIFILECDIKPRHREIVVTVIGE